MLIFRTLKFYWAHLWRFIIVYFIASFLLSHFFTEYVETTVYSEEINPLILMPIILDILVVQRLCLHDKIRRKLLQLRRGELSPMRLWWAWRWRWTSMLRIFFFTANNFILIGGIDNTPIQLILLSSLSIFVMILTCLISLYVSLNKLLPDTIDRKGYGIT